MAPQRKWNAFENAAFSPKGVTDYALLNGEWPRFTSKLRNSLAGAVEVFKLPLGDLITRQQSVLGHLLVSPFSSLGIALAIGKNYASSSHVDSDMGFTFAGSFTTEAGRRGNSFVFPTYRMKIDFPGNTNNVSLFAFNPKFEVCYLIKLSVPVKFQLAIFVSALC